MTVAVVEAPDIHLEIKLGPLSDISEADFVALCAANPDIRLERTAKGEIVIMAPEGGTSGNRNFSLAAQLHRWASADGRGKGFASSTGFRLPNGAIRSPDVAWVSKARLANLTPDQKEQFLPICPDFVVEVRVPRDRVADLQAKLEEYLANGASLGWLIDPQGRVVSVYRPGRRVQTLENPDRVSADPELPGFSLDLTEIWEPGL